MTLPDHQTPTDVLERYAAAQPKLQKFFDMAVNYFRCKCLVLLLSEVADRRHQPVTGYRAGMLAECGTLLRGAGEVATVGIRLQEP